MGISDFLVLGIPLWIWGLMFIPSSVFIFFAWLFTGDRIEKIKGFYYRKRFPEKLLKVIIHFKTGYFKIYWRLIPDKLVFQIDKKTYLYDKDIVTKEHDFFGVHDKHDRPLFLVVKNVFSKKNKKGKEVFELGEMGEYTFDKVYKIKEKKKKYAEIHYMYNVPLPLNFDVETKELKFTAKSLKEFEKNDLFEKLLRLSGEKMMFTLMLMLIVVNVVVTLFLLSKEMGWIT